MDVYYLSIAALILLAGLSFFLGYYHQCLKAKIVKRAHKMLPNEDVSVLKKKLGEMMGTEVRELYALNDEEFLKTLSNMLKK